ncbi:hypothetical protein ACJ41O_007806 [Fusarium nematophilum]
MDPKDIVPIAHEIAKEAETLNQLLGDNHRSNDSHKGRGPEFQLWNHPSQGSAIEQSQSKLLGLVQKLNRTLRGPQDFLHELVASNWDKGALYCLLERKVLDQIPLDGEATLSALASKTEIPSEKLLPMLRLAACEQVVQEPFENVFRHGPISRELVTDPGLRAFIGFQLYETRVASAHLADSLKKPNPTWTGQSAFKYAWGLSMYDWHKAHPDKGARFATAMQSVANSLDPGNDLLETWLSKAVGENEAHPKVIVDIVRKPGPTSQVLAEKFPSLLFKTQELPDRLHDFTVDRDDPSIPRVYILKSVLWNLPDEDCSTILQALFNQLEKSPDSLILVNDLMSPLPGAFKPHVDKAYRRRDVTVMTMHNAKLRTDQEWRSIFIEPIQRDAVCYS